MSKLEACKVALEKQENEYRLLLEDALEGLLEEVMNIRCSNLVRCISEEMMAETLKRLTANKILTKGAKVLEAKKKLNKEKSLQVPTIYPKSLMEAVQRGEIENVTKYPYFKEDGLKFRITSFASKILFFSWSEKEGLNPSYEISYNYYHKNCKEPLEIFNRIKKELESKND